MASPSRFSTISWRPAINTETSKWPTTSTTPWKNNCKSRQMPGASKNTSNTWRKNAGKTILKESGLRCTWLRLVTRSRTRWRSWSRKSSTCSQSLCFTRRSVIRPGLGNGLLSLWVRRRLTVMRLNSVCIRSAARVWKRWTGVKSTKLLWARLAKKNSSAPTVVSKVWARPK